MSEYYRDAQVTLLLGDALDVLRTLPDESVDCVVTSPPYFHQRDYEIDGQYGLEATPAQYVQVMQLVFAEAYRVLAKDGTLWLNLGDTYNNRTRGAWRGSSDGFTGRSESPGWQRQTDIPEKSLIGIPWRVAFALQDDGWVLRNANIWEKTDAMPESVTDRLAARYEHVFLFTRSQRYWFDLDAIREPHIAPHRTPGATAFQARNANLPRTSTKAYVGPNTAGRNPGDLWKYATASGNGEHFATFPIQLPTRCIKAGCKPNGTVLDPFSGSGTTGEAARMLGRRYVGIDLNPEYHDLAIKRFAQGVLDFETA